ncbi:uncharacterized protein VTP21DRAFT_7907 [Calcarisporiella thermophila]|uniref:uncharacterized protein n=1 Tax=Calcarisporiella thermophila TaxID=911321 RepID=UPI003744A949
MSRPSISVSVVMPSGYGVSNCGYCKGKSSSRTYGMVAMYLTCMDYQCLIDRGWRRSGCYIYKPNLRDSCCPQYTIRLDSTRFSPSKSQKKIIGKFNKYVRGKRPIGDERLRKRKHRLSDTDVVGADAREENGDGVGSLPEWIELLRKVEGEPDSEHPFEICLEPASYSDEKFEVYSKYQIAVHHDPPSRVRKEGFYNFLVDSPLIPEDFPTGTKGSITPGYGSFHQTYRLDGRLIAVAVLDILPACVSSVYFFYDPDFSHLSLGKYSALREIAMARSLYARVPGLQWYYMGFYIHRCPKMRYKAEYSPSDLLDPETYQWAPYVRCLPLLESKHYAEFSSILKGPDGDQGEHPGSTNNLSIEQQGNSGGKAGSNGEVVAAGHRQMGDTTKGKETEKRATQTKDVAGPEKVGRSEEDTRMLGKEDEEAELESVANSEEEEEEEEEDGDFEEERQIGPLPPGVLDPATVTTEDLRGVRAIYGGKLWPVTATPHFRISEEIRNAIMEYYCVVGRDLANRMIVNLKF